MTLYAPCIILQYVYKATRCTKFQDQFYKLYIAFGIRQYMPVPHVSTYTKCDVQLIKLLLMTD